MHPTDDVLNEFVEETLGATERAEVEQHLASCAPCRATVDDLREIRAVAKTLEFREPPARAWSRLERAIKLEQEHLTQSAQSPQSQLTPRSRRSLREISVWLAAAAAVVIAVGIGYRVLPRGTTTSAPVASTAPANDAAASVSVEAELKAAEEHYQKAITGLEQIANAGKGSLDTQTASTLQKNLSVIDQAINESRAAVRAQPTSEPAQQSLLESFKAKLALLQDTVALINEMRKGNDAGAARIGSGLRQKG
ncbi:MAG TPA: zf-HC2 domain-containing protein [Vicinamibacterales bacterium]|nr:zf-HC2 domain-containing protein [Vicinamibacterales bacterium]